MPANDQRRLDQWDPAEAWRPWQPTAKQPWNLKWAAHLLRRAAFGFPAPRSGEDAWDGLQRIVKQGPGATLAELFQPPDAEFNELLETTGQQIASDDDLENLRSWWLYRMLHSPQPLVERMTLFWHGHFTTSANKVRRLPWLFEQNQTLRRHALGRFGPLVLSVSRDPAMIVWLDSQRNVKGGANENYGRELMELFTLGVGHYSEADVRAAARAFTGWQTQNDRFAFEPRLHDDGPKTLLGQTGNFGGDDVVRILLEQPATAQFIVGKLFQHFLSEAESPGDALLEPLARQFRESGYEIAPLVRRMLSSRLFFSDTVYRQRIKGPAEFVVGAVRGLDAKLPMPRLASWLSGLGQELFAPPNPKGWDGGKAWLNTATLLARDNLIWELVAPPQKPTAPKGAVLSEASAAMEPTCDPAALVKRHASEGADAQLGLLIDLFLAGGATAAARSRLTDYLNGADAAGRDRRLRQTLHMLLVLPEYQLA